MAGLLSREFPILSEQNRQFLAPDDRGDQIERWEKVKAPTVVSGGDSSPVLQFVACPFDLVALPVKFTIILPRLPSVYLGRYDRSGAPGPDVSQYPVVLVSLVGYHGAGLDSIRQGYRLRAVSRLSPGESEPNRLALGVAAR